MTWTLHHGDCLDGLAALPAMSVDLVITDPPYSINTKSDGMGKLSPWADYCNAAHWYTAWIGQARRVLKPDGALWSFLNWRSFVTFQKAACDLGWPIESLLVWDKDWIGPGGQKGLRPSYEFVALWAMPDFAIPDRGLRDLQTFAWSGTKPSGHPAEKPEALARWLIGVSRPAHLRRGPVVVADPFSGSGTVGAAAVAAGCFVGWELDERWHREGGERIANAAAQGGLFAGEAA